MSFWRAGIWPEPGMMQSQLWGETGEELLDMDPRVPILRQWSGWKKFEDLLGKWHLHRKHTLFTYSTYLFETEEADTKKKKTTNPLFTPTEWYFGLPAVPSRAKSTRKRHKSGTSLAVPGAGMGKETEAWVVRGEVRKQWVGRATSRLAQQTLVRGLESLSREVIDGGVYSVLYIKSSSHHLVQLLFLEYTERKTVHLEGKRAKYLLFYFLYFYVKYLPSSGKYHLRDKPYYCLSLTPSKFA